MESDENKKINHYTVIRRKKKRQNADLDNAQHLE